MDSKTASRSSSPRVVSFLLHAHLPYGIRPDLEASLEQAWLFEAVTDCYLPLLEMVERLESRPKQAWFTLSLSPTLLELWAHPEFERRYRKHLNDGLAIIEHEAGNAHHPLERRKLALEIKKQRDRAAKQFDAIDGKLTEAFSRQAKQGKIELITTAATHAFLPAFQNNPNLRHFQIDNGIETFTRHTGLKPKGFWLPECAYFGGIENDLLPHGIEYFCLEARGFNAATPLASVRQPLACLNGILALGRDAALSQKVWSARSGYPGHANYREFHHDGIHQVDDETCGAFALPDGGRLPFGLKYWRVTGSPEKDWYAPETARGQAESDAKDFVAHLEASEEGLVFLPFDAELFGHWWREGPHWLEQVLRAARASEKSELHSAGSAAAAFPKPPVCRPAASTWGRKSDYSFWINRDTDWIYPLLKKASETYESLVSDFSPENCSPLARRALEQAGRELLLASASDWPFMIRAGSTVDYAMQRMREHIGRFHYVAQSIRHDMVEESKLELLEKLNPAFTDISFKSFLP